MSVVKHTSKYRKCRDSIIAINRQVRQSIVEAYRLTGKYIYEIEQDGESRARYGTRLIATLAGELAKALGPGYSVPNLKRMRRFYISNRKSSTSSQLDWSQHVELMPVKDAAKREALVRRIKRESLAARDIRAIVHDIVAGEDEGRETQDDGRNSGSRPSSRVHSSLNVIRNTPHVFSLVSQKDCPRPRGVDVVDCGFRIWRMVENGYGQLRKSAFAKATADMVTDSYGQLQGRSIVTSRNHPQPPVTVRNVTISSTPSYTYPAHVIKVVDADTLWCRIDCGFGTIITEKLRLRGIDAPELSTAAGQRAKRFVEKVLKPCPLIVISTHKDETDKYARYLADIFYIPEETNPERIVKEGAFLNQELLDKGHAVPWEG